MMNDEYENSDEPALSADFHRGFQPSSLILHPLQDA
jgi:hypothetical protein